MSKLTEYLALIPRGLTNIDGLVEGLRNSIRIEKGTLPKEEEDEILRRRLICSTCPLMSVNAIANGTYSSKRDDPHCTMCGCPISTRTASLTSNCGIEHYNKTNPKNPLPLKWEAFNTEK